MKNFYSLTGGVVFLFCISFILFLLIPLVSCKKNPPKEIVLNNIFVGNNKIGLEQKSDNFYFDTDKENYFFGEILKLKIYFENFSKEDNIKLKVSILKDLESDYLLNKLREVKIKESVYEMVYSIKLPYFSECGNFQKGEHLVKIDVIKNGKNIDSKTKNIFLK